MLDMCRNILTFCKSIQPEWKYKTSYWYHRPEHKLSFPIFISFDFRIVFVNNFAFGPDVDHKLKERFATMREGMASIKKEF